MKYNSIKQLVTAILLITIFSCESSFEDAKTYPILHGLVIEGQVPKIILGESLETFSEYPFNLEYYNQPYQYPNIGISVSTDNFHYSNFEWNDIYFEDNAYPPRHISNSISYYSDNAYIPESGKEYSIEVKEIPWDDGTYQYGFKYLRAKTYVPEKIPISMESEIISTNEYDETRRFTISFDDPIEDRNYYYLTITQLSFSEDFSLDTLDIDQIWRNHAYYQYNTISISNLIYMAEMSLDPEYQEYVSDYNSLPGFLLSDDHFNGQTNIIQLDLELYNTSRTSYLVVDLMHVSEDYYNYYNSLERQYISQTDVFTEPTQIFTNIENGLGVFAGASISTVSEKLIYTP